MVFNDLRYKANELEEKAKIARINGNLEESAKLFLEASKIYKGIQEERNYIWNYANFCKANATIYYSAKKNKESIYYFKKCEELFLELGSIKEAFYNSTKCLNNYNYLEKDMKNVMEFIEAIEIYLDRYKSFSKTKEYQDTKLTLYKFKSIKFRLEGNIEPAKDLAKMAYEYAEDLYNQFKDESHKRAILYNKHMYWDLKAKIFRWDSKYEDAAFCYKNSAETLSDLSKKEEAYYGEYMNYYLCKALANKKDKTSFEKNMDKSIECSKKTGDKKNTDFMQGYKRDSLSKFSNSLEDRIMLLNEAKSYYYKASANRHAKNIEFKLYYLQSKNELKNGNYEKSLGFIDKAIKSSEYADFPNIVTNKSIVKNERFLHESYLNVSQGNFLNAFEAVEKWLNGSEDIKNTNRYEFFKILSLCYEILSKADYIKEDLFVLDEKLNSIREQKLSFTLYRVCSLAYSYLSLCLNNIKNDKILKMIEFKIISHIATNESAYNVKQSLEAQNALEDFDWLSRLPWQFSEKFNDCFFLLNDLPEYHKHLAFREFYTLLEKYLRVIVIFNAKLLWQNEFESKLEEHIQKNKKPFEKFTLGDFISSLKLLINFNAKYLVNTPEDTIELLEKHNNLRNSLTHDWSDEYSDIDIVNDISKIFLDLILAFPTTIKILNPMKKPWYDIEINWNKFPKLISIFSEDELENSGYYLEPNLNVTDSHKLYPSFIIPKMIKNDT